MPMRCPAMQWAAVYNATRSAIGWWDDRRLTQGGQMEYRAINLVQKYLRGYTAFTETAEPEEVLDFLRQYHGALGPLVAEFEGTLDQFSGDGIMVFFDDPVPIPDPAERAVKM